VGGGVTAKPTRVEVLRYLADDRERGRWCLGKAEQCRHAYELGERQAQEHAAGGRPRTAVTDVTGAARWRDSPEARGYADGDRMYTTWAVAYFAAYQAMVAWPS
jgi:hypothetical protein